MNEPPGRGFFRHFFWERPRNPGFAEWKILEGLRDPEKHGRFADRCLRLTAQCAQKGHFLSLNSEIILDAPRHPGFPRKFPISGWKA